MRQRQEQAVRGEQGAGGGGGGGWLFTPSNIDKSEDMRAPSENILNKMFRRRCTSN